MFQTWVRLALGSVSVADRDPSFTKRTSKLAPRRGFMNHLAPPPKLIAWFHASGMVTPGVVSTVSDRLVTFVGPSPALR